MSLRTRIGSIWASFRDRGKIEKEPKSDQVPREGALRPFKKWPLERVRKTIQNALRNMCHLYFRKGRNNAKVWAGDEIQGFHGFSVMQENFQKGMPFSPMAALLIKLIADLIKLLSSAGL